MHLNYKRFDVGLKFGNTSIRTDFHLTRPGCLLACLLLSNWLFISTYKAHILHDQILHPNPTQHLNLTTTLLTINKQQIRNLRGKVIDNGLLIARLEFKKNVY